MKDNYVKLLFEVEYDQDEIIKENVWAKKMDEDTYQIDNIPFYAYLYACDDIVNAEETDGQLKVVKLVKASGNSTVRLLFESEEELLLVKKEVESLSMEAESMLRNKLLAVNIPNNLSYKEVKNFFDKGEEFKQFEYEEACISEKHQLDIK
ncbi:DUF4265 domain-containing protein [Chryseobacterium indoltheticum]|uniref:DUF4265 domain-containing protein n=1 Tax=Chryseobacterium indoltheticum TaxID=254 RepID=UPI0040427E84